jgi:hypothetical protein
MRCALLFVGLSVTIALLFLLPAHAAELILPAPPYLYNDGVNTELGHGYASVCVNTPAGVSANIGWSFDTDAHWQSAHALRYRTGITAGSATGMLCLPIKGLAANTLYRVCPVMADGSGNATNCTNSGTDPNRFFTFTTQPAPAVDPVPPTRANVSDFDTSYPANTPAISGARDFSVSSDCHDLTAQIATAVAAANSSGQTAAVTIPSSAVCSGSNLPSLPARAAGQPWVIVRTSQEPLLPPPGISVTKAEYGQYMPVMKVTSARSGFINGDGTTNAKIRFVGIRIIFDDGTAFPGAGNPTYNATYLWRVTVAASWIIFDRCVFDGQGYPSRIQAAVYISGGADFQYVAWTGCHFANIYNWQPWMGQMKLTGTSTKTLASAEPFLVGRGDSVVTVQPWSIQWNGGDTTGLMYVLPDGSLTFSYAADTTSPDCTGVTCVQDGSLTVPRTGLKLNAAPMTITGGVWSTPAPTVYYFWGNAGTGNGLISLGEAESFAIISDATFGYHPTIEKLIVQNSTFDGAGILVFFSSFGVTKDILIDRNEFSATPGCFMPNPPDAGRPFSCDMRYPFEIKNGYSIDFTGNTIHDWYETRDTDGSWFSLKPDTTIDPGAYTGDIYIADNYATQVVGCFYISGELNNGNGIWTYPKPIRRVAYHNNYCQSDAWTRTSYWGKYGLGAPNFGFSVIDQGAVDISISHNTFYDTRGPGPGIFVGEAFSHGIALTGNIFTYHQSSGAYRGFVSGYYGTGRWSAATIPDMGFNLPVMEGTAGLNAAIPSLSDTAGASWQWDNVMIPGCVDSSPANCGDTTFGQALATAPISRYPATTLWPAGATLASRYLAAGVGESVHTGATRGADGLAYGFDPASNAQARGQIVADIEFASLTSAAATVRANVPDAGAACFVTVKPSGSERWRTTGADSTNSGGRLLRVTGLTGKTEYIYRVWCAGGPPTAPRRFTTP